MSRKRGSLLADLPYGVSEQPADVKAGFRRWRAELRQDPSLAWRTTSLRGSLWVLLGLCLLLVACVSPSSPAPVADGQGPGQAIQLAALCATCTNPACRGSYTTRQPMELNAWPFTCRERAGRGACCAKLCSACRNGYAKAPGDAEDPR